VSRRDQELGRDGPTADPRRRAIQEARDEDAAKRLRADVTKLLLQPEFRRWVAHVVYGVAGVKRPLWCRDAEIHKRAARHDFGVELLAELGRLDPKGFVLLEQEHVNRMAEELELAAVVNQERSDAS
jgi:hypothetical protein